MATRYQVLNAIVAMVFLSVPTSLVQAQESTEEVVELKLSTPRTYTSGDQVDYTVSPTADAKKGATVLLWKKQLQAPLAEVEISPLESNSKRSFFVDTHFFHTMVFFDRSYTWRVRFADSDEKPLSEFSEPVEFRVLRSGVSLHANDSSETQGEVVVVKDGDNGDSVRIMAPQQQERGVRQVLKVNRKDGVANASRRTPASVQTVQISAPEPSKDRAKEASILKKLFVDESDGNNEVDFNY